MLDYFDTLRKFWGYTAFRPLQEDVIKSVLEGKDTLGLMPTGGGKSLTFQVPAMTMPGICLVITPLIALMQDQVETLKKLYPVRFNYKASPQEESIGFIAEDVPDLVATKNRKSIGPMDVIAVLTKVIQEQQKSIEELSARIEDLEKQRGNRTPDQGKL